MNLILLGIVVGGVALIVLAIVVAARGRGPTRIAEEQTATIRAEGDAARRLEIAASRSHRPGAPLALATAAEISRMAMSIARTQHLAAHGQCDVVTLTAVHPTGRGINGVPELEVTLQHDGAPISATWFVASWAQAHLRPGASVPIRHDPDDTRAIALDIAVLRASPAGSTSRACAYCCTLYEATSQECPTCGAAARVPI